MVAIFRPVFDEALPGKAGLYGFPKVGECLFGHVAMSHKVVWCANKFVFGKAADIYKWFIRKLDATAGICTRNKDVLVFHQDFAVRHLTIVTHGVDAPYKNHQASQRHIP